MDNGTISYLLYEAESANYWSLGAGIRPILADFYGPHMSKANSAIQSILRLRVPLEQLRLDMFESSRLAMMAKVVESEVQTDPSIATYVARAINQSTNFGSRWNLMAILSIAHSIPISNDSILQAVVSVVAGDYDPLWRLQAIDILSERRCSTIIARNALIIATHDTHDKEGRVAAAAVKAIGTIGFSWADIGDAVRRCIKNVSTRACGEALSLMAAIHGAESETVVATALGIAMLEYSPWLFRPPRRMRRHFTDDLELERDGDIAENMHDTFAANQEIAKDLLRRRSISIDDLFVKSDQNRRVSPEQEIVLAWFAKVNLDMYRTPLQVFWCIGKLEYPAFANRGPAMGWHKLNDQLQGRHPQFKFVDLPIGVTFLHRDCIPSIDALFDREPFYSQAWSDEERGMELRAEVMRGKRREAVWTQKAFRAWQYTNVFLKLQDLLPTMCMKELD